MDHRTPRTDDAVDIREIAQGEFSAVAELAVRLLSADRDELAALYAATPFALRAAFASGQPIGVAYARIDGEKYAPLAGLAVIPERRRSGIARRLLEGLEHTVFVERNYRGSTFWCPRDPAMEGLLVSAGYDVFNLEIEAGADIEVREEEVRRLGGMIARRKGDSAALQFHLRAYDPERYDHLGRCYHATRSRLRFSKVNTRLLMTDDEALAFLRAIESGEVTLISRWGDPAAQNGPFPYDASNGWEIWVFNDVGEWDYVDEIRAPDGRYTGFDQSLAIEHYEPSPEVIERAYGFPAGAG